MKLIFLNLALPITVCNRHTIFELEIDDEVYFDDIHGVKIRQIEINDI